MKYDYLTEQENKALEFIGGYERVSGLLKTDLSEGLKKATGQEFINLEREGLATLEDLCLMLKQEFPVNSQVHERFNMALHLKATMNLVTIRLPTAEEVNYFSEGMLQMGGPEKGNLLFPILIGLGAYDDVLEKETGFNWDEFSKRAREAQFKYIRAERKTA